MKGRPIVLGLNYFGCGVAIRGIEAAREAGHRLARVHVGASRDPHSLQTSTLKSLYSSKAWAQSSSWGAVLQTAAIEARGTR